MLMREEAIVTRACGSEERERKSCVEKRKRLGTPSEEQVARKEDMFCEGDLFGMGRDAGRRTLSRRQRR